MAETAFQKQYRQETIDVFEEGMSWLRQTTVQESVNKGNTAEFLVAGSGNASAVTRGVNGLIPARADDLTQNTCTLVEWHDLVRKTRFNIFASQGNQREIMQKTSMRVMNRRVDADIVAQLDTATNNLGTATTASLGLVQQAMVTLGENEVPVEEVEKMWFVASDAFWGYLGQIPEFNSADFVETKYLTGPMVRTKRWGGFNWIRHHRLTGGGSASEKCYAYHCDAIGSAFDMGEGFNTAVGYDEEQDYSYARTSSFTGAKLLQQEGIVQVLHDASAI